MMISSDSADKTTLLNGMPVSKKNNSKKTRMPADYTPSKNAVICGRGKACTTNPGNRKLRSLIKDFLEAYGKANNKVEKTEIVSSIMEAIKKDCEDDPAFVKKEEGNWWEVDDAFAREKIGCIFRDSLFTKYRSSTKAKLARRKQQVAEEEHLIQQQKEHQKLQSSSYGGLSGMDLSHTFGAPPALMNYNAAANNQARQLSQMLGFQGATDMAATAGNEGNILTHQQQLGLYSAADAVSAQKHASHRRDLLRSAVPAMMRFPGGANQNPYIDSSIALGEAFDLLQNMGQPARNHQTVQLMESLQHQQQQQQQTRDINYVRELLGVIAPNAALQQHQEQHQQEQQEQQPHQLAVDHPPVALAPVESPLPSPEKPTSSSSAAIPKTTSKKKRKHAKDEDGNELESLPDDISGIFD